MKNKRQNPNEPQANQRTVLAVTLSDKAEAAISTSSKKTTLHITSSEEARITLEPTQDA